MDGVPLSAFELCHYGPDYRKKGRLVVRRIGPRKRSLQETDLLPYYAYVHVDLRNDWLSRSLRSGSPAGGDYATWWTSRPGLERTMTAKIRNDKADIFDWPVNIVSIYPLSITERGIGHLLRVTLTGYSPYFEHFEISFDSGQWQKMSGYEYQVYVEQGTHRLESRLVTKGGWRGPVSSVEFRVN